ncbi:unnamed protein product [Amoebophrya sp. A25]|nr:unnamed protein product [Amoebophrya sp. A25]|eukprot:GSA25T00008483001.1
MNANTSKVAVEKTSNSTGGCGAPQGKTLPQVQQSGTATASSAIAHHLTKPPLQQGGNSSNVTNTPTNKSQNPTHPAPTSPSASTSPNKPAKIYKSAMRGQMVDISSLVSRSSNLQPAMRITKPGDDYSIEYLNDEMDEV